MARIVLTAVAAAAAALLLHFHPWEAATQSQEPYRAATEPAVNLPSLPTPSQSPKPVEDPLPPASSLVPPPVVSVSATCPQSPVPGSVVPPLPETKTVPPPANSLQPPQPGPASPPMPLQVPQSPPTLPSPVPPTPAPSLGDKGLFQPPEYPSRDKIRAKSQIPEPPMPPPTLGPGTDYSNPVAPMGPGPAPVGAVKPLTSPWSFHLEIVDGKNLITAKVGKTVQFRVVCEKLEIHSPAGSIVATGKVKIASQALEANCEVLTIHLQDEAVLLTGAAQMKCQHEGKELDLRADSFSLKLSDIQGTSSKAAPKDVDPLFGAAHSNTSAAPHAETMRPPIITVTPGPVVK